MPLLLGVRRRLGPRDRHHDNSGTTADNLFCAKYLLGYEPLFPVKTVSGNSCRNCSHNHSPYPAVPA